MKPSFAPEAAVAAVAAAAPAAPAERPLPERYRDAVLEIPAALRESAREMGVSPEIHKADFIFDYIKRVPCKGDHEKAIRRYYAAGRRSSQWAREFVDDAWRVKKRVGEDWAPRRVMDFAAGYGGTTRHYPHAFPGSVITACDIHDEANAFNRDVLGLEAQPSSFTPEDVRFPKQDVITVFSLFSHLPRETFTRWLKALAQSLDMGGALIFTTNAYVNHTLRNTGVEVDENGYGFRPQSEQKDLPGEQYGLTVSYSNFVAATLAQVPELRLAGLREGYWQNAQDMYLCVRWR